MVIFSLSITLMAYSVVCVCAGGLALRILVRSNRLTICLSPFAKLTTEFVLGQGVLASLWLLMALAGWFTFPLIALMGMFLLIADARFVLRDLRLVLRQVIRIWRGTRQESLGWQAIAFLVVAIFMAGLTSLGRPLGEDAAAFYMALPKVVAASQRLVALPGYEDFTQAGLQGEMHYAVLTLLSSVDTARLFGWISLLSIAAFLAMICSYVGFGRRAQWIAQAMLFTSTAVVITVGDGKVDLFAAAFGLGAYYWAMRAGEDDHPLAIRLAGLFTGFAIVAKLSYLPVLLPGVMLLVAWKHLLGLGRVGERLVEMRSLVVSMARLGLWLGLALLSQLVKNSVLFANPIAPFGSSGMGWTDQVWFGPETTKRILLSYPLALTFGKYWAQAGNISPLVLAFLPGFMLSYPQMRRHRALSRLALAALLGLVCWMVLRPSILAPRYILAPLLLFIPLAAFSAEALARLTKPNWFAPGIGLLTLTILLGMSLRLLFFSLGPGNTLLYLTGQIDECARDGPYCRAMRTINQEAEPGDRVFLGSPYRFWFRPDLLQCLQSEQEFGLFSMERPEQRWQWLYVNGFRYLLEDQITHAQLFDSFDTRSAPAWLRLVPLYQEARLVVFRLDSEDPPRLPAKSCVQRFSPAWDVVSR